MYSVVGGKKFAAITRRYVKLFSSFFTAHKLNKTSIVNKFSLNAMGFLERGSFFSHEKSHKIANVINIYHSLVDAIWTLKNPLNSKK